MQPIQGIARNQLQVSSLEDTISHDNPVRFIDAFVNSIDLEKIGFTPRVLKTEGRPSFDTRVFLKIYLYGYLNGTCCPSYNVVYICYFFRFLFLSFVGQNDVQHINLCHKKNLLPLNIHKKLISQDFNFFHFLYFKS
jgi:hypothetical protein